jgi:hypothetical protein
MLEYPQQPTIGEEDDEESSFSSSPPQATIQNRKQPMTA